MRFASDFDVQEIGQTGPVVVPLPESKTYVSDLVLGENDSEIVEDFGKAAIRQSIRNIMDTQRGDRVLDASFGAPAAPYFEDATPEVINAYMKDLINEITKDEPRITILVGQCFATMNFTNQQLDIVICYVITATMETSTDTFQVGLTKSG